MSSSSEVDTNSLDSVQIKSLNAPRDALSTGNWDTFMDGLEKRATEKGLWQVFVDGTTEKWTARVKANGFHPTLADYEKRLVQEEKAIHLLKETLPLNYPGLLRGCRSIENAMKILQTQFKPAEDISDHLKISTIFEVFIQPSDDGPEKDWHIRLGHASKSKLRQLKRFYNNQLQVVRSWEDDQTET